MADIDLTKALAQMGSAETQKGAMTLTELLKSADGVLKQVDSVINLLQKAEKSVICSTYVRMQAKSQGIELKAFEEKGGIIPRSPHHEAMLNGINNMTSEQLGELIGVIQEHDRRKADKSKAGKH